MFARTYADAARKAYAQWIETDDPQVAEAHMKRGDRLCRHVADEVKARPADIKRAAMIRAAFD